MTRLSNDVAFDAEEVTFRDLKQLALLLNVDETEIDDIVNSVKDRFEIPRDKKIKKSNPKFEAVKKAVHDQLNDIILGKLDEMDYDGDDTYNSMYWFAKGYNAKKAESEAIEELMNLPFQPEIKYLGIPHAPKHPKTPKRYIDSNDSTYLNYIKRKHFNVKDKVNDKVRDTLRKRFNEKIENERTQIQTSKATYRRK